MATENTVLSLSFDSKKLQLREAALHEAGFGVVNAYSPGHARSEIEMRRCGIFMTCTLVPDIVNADLIRLFRRCCPTGLVILVTGNNSALVAAHEPVADVRLAETDDPQGIPAAIRGHSRNPASAPQ